MSENKQKPRKLTAKQEAFVQAYCTPRTKTYNNATQSAIAAGYSERTAARNTPQIMNNNGVKQAINQLKADLAAENGFTREKQLKDLEAFKEMARRAENPNAGISAIREQNEMLGFHRELAPNAEREAAEQRRRMTEEEWKLAEKLANELNREAAGEGEVRTVKPDFGQKRA